VKFPLRARKGVQAFAVSQASNTLLEFPAAPTLGMTATRYAAAGTGNRRQNHTPN
jgi:hypothetical protein